MKPLAKADTVPEIVLPTCPGNSRLMDVHVEHNQLLGVGRCHYEAEDAQGTARPGPATHGGGQPVHGEDHVD